MKIGLIREDKQPPDSRVALTPEQAAELNHLDGHSVVVQPSTVRAYSNLEYQAAGLKLQEDLADCDLLLGIKEVPIENLIPSKTYCFFAHVIKKQAYNRPLLQALLKNKIRLIDYEVLTDERGRRIIAFGYFAGMVGAHNGIWTYGQRTGQFELPRLKDLHDYAAAKAIYQELELPPLRIVLTGTGRVGKGARQVLEDMGIRRVAPQEYLHKTFDEAVFTQLECCHYARRKDGAPFHKADFYQHPEAYESSFAPYTRNTDIFINGIYWDNNAPVFFTREEMQDDNFHIQTIADITCDIAPVASVPSTLRASTIADPVFGYDPVANAELPAFAERGVDVMSIDNLPSELPRDASQAFGRMFLDRVFPEFTKPHSAMLDRATVTRDGHLGKHFDYLADFAAGRE
jgi:alanine dehydrogenase